MSGDFGALDTLSVAKEDLSQPTEAVPEQPAHDDALARRLLQCAQGMFEKWPEGFVGFSATIRCRDDDREIAGDVRVFTGGRVEISLAPAGLRSWTEALLRAIAYARTPRFFKDVDGRYPISFEPDDGHPVGRRVRVHLGRGAWRAYRIDPKGRIRELETANPVRRTTAAYEELVRTSPGRIVPTRMRVIDWDVATQTPLEAAEVEDTFCRVDHVVLPARRRTTVIHGVASWRLTIELEHHALLRERWLWSARRDDA